MRPCVFPKKWLIEWNKIFLTMRIAILSDIHSNLAALEAVIRKMDDLGISTAWCLGDIVGYGPFPNECLEIVRTRCSLVVTGNHDSGVVGVTPVDDFNEFGLRAIYWTRGALTAEHLEYLRGLPLSETHESCTLVHASPFEPSKWHYLHSIRGTAKSFHAFATRLCFIGHTHFPVVIGEDGTVNRFTAKGRYIINVGSVGQPRDGNPAAAFGVYDSDLGHYESVRVPYAIEKTAEAIVRAGLPEYLGQRLYQGT
jgi:diadenosine tetraphosphatase ApaH/serine/threonine PP2A family protein phosphatase